MIESIKPQAKADGIVTQEMTDELLVYDLHSNKAHCLNSTAGFVWQNCDGESTVEDIRTALEESTGDEVRGDVIALAVQQLAANNLLTELVAEVDLGISRRALIKKAGFAAAIALPIVASIAVPSNVMAATSGAASGSPCTAPIDCASGACLGSPGTCL